MKYTFVSLGRLESIGVRLGGPGLGNILFPWARAIVYAKEHNLTRVQTTWKNLKLGTFFRKERDKRFYFNLFTEKEGIDGIRKFLLLNFSKKVKVFSGMEGLFGSFKHEHQFIRSELLKIVNPYYLSGVDAFNRDSVAIHIRMGDFQIAQNEEILRNGCWNHRLPLEWYKSIIEKIRDKCDLPIYIFSDGRDEDIRDILDIENCERAYFGSAISDMLALGSAKVLVASASTFSMWASFLGKVPTIWFPGQMREKIIEDSTIFEGTLDYNDKLPQELVKILNNA